MLRLGLKNRYTLPLLIITALTIAVIFFIVPSSYEVAFPATSSSTQSQTSTSIPINKIPVISNAPEVIIGYTHIFVELATNTVAVQKGLSGRTSLGDNNGMLFIFSKADIYHFWMPDMHFPLDMIWINNGKIVDISANVTNIFDPSAPVFYKPKVPAQYVLEVNANFSTNHGIHIGDAVQFKNIPIKK